MPNHLVTAGGARRAFTPQPITSVKRGERRSPAVATNLPLSFSHSSPPLLRPFFSIDLLVSSFTGLLICCRFSLFAKKSNDDASRNAESLARWNTIETDAERAIST